MPMTREELDRRLRELDMAGARQVRANTPPPQARDLSALDVGAMQAIQRMRSAQGAAPPQPTPGQVLGPNMGAPPPMPMPQQAPPRPPTAAFPPIPQNPRNLGALRPMTAVKGY